MKKIVICEDHPIYSIGLQDYLQNHFEIIANLTSGAKTVEFLEEHQADFLILDLNLPDINGLEVIKQIQQKNTPIKIVVISMYSDKMLIEKCKNLKTHAYCSKNITNPELLKILQNKEQKQFSIDSSITKQSFGCNTDFSINNFETKIKLTTREIELIQLFSKGLTSKKVAIQLNVSTFTIETHKKNIYKKLNINSIVELVTYYYENF